MELPTAAYVILGMLRLGARSGYDVKRAVEASARFFWTISQAQFSPNLKRLERAGLVQGHPEPRGRRRRRVYDVTPEGERVLVEWLRREEELGFEVRDVATLKFFFADLLSGEQALEHVQAIHARSERLLEQLKRESEPVGVMLERHGERFPLLTLRLGMAIQQAIADWCTATERDLSRSVRRGRKAT
jgi:PadR family transcriptional regulator AphA